MKRNTKKSDGGVGDSNNGRLLLFGDRYRPLLVFALCLALFHLANAAMLPLVGQKLAAIYGPEHATVYVHQTLFIYNHTHKLLLSPTSLLLRHKQHLHSSKR